MALTKADLFSIMIGREYACPERRNQQQRGASNTCVGAFLILQLHFYGRIEAAGRLQIIVNDDCCYL
jgi:hypothetical protein